MRAHRLAWLLTPALAMLLAGCRVTPALPPGATPAPTRTPPPGTPLPITTVKETGIAAPQWRPSGYSDFGSQLGALKQATAASWVEMPILFRQATNDATTITVANDNTPTPDSVAQGIASAHAAHLHVFITPLLDVTKEPGWAGSVQPADLRAWFDAWWNALLPYVRTAQRYGADQMAIGTEMNWLQDHAPAALWQELIGRFRSVFHGRLTYDTNWDMASQETTQNTVPSWMRDPRLFSIGVSEYENLVATPTYLPPATLTALWHERIQAPLDAFASKLGRPILISELGYRDTADALYHPYDKHSTAPVSQAEQAAAFSAAISTVKADSNLIGVYCWQWNYGDAFKLEGTQAASTIKGYYETM